MVILGGLEIVAAGYLLKELHNENKGEEERERERRRRRRHHSRDDHHRPHHHDDDSPPRPGSRPPQQHGQQLRPPQQPGGPPRPYSAPPPQNRPQMLPVALAATAATMWPHGPPQQGPLPQARPPQSYGTWPQGPPQQQQPQMMQQRPPQSQWQGGPPQNNPNNFVPQPLQRPQTMYPPPGVHIDLKTGKIQHDMLPPEMPRDVKSGGGEAREYFDGGRQQSYERRRENSMPSEQQRPQYPLAYGAEHGAHNYSQPQINVTPAAPPRQGYVELDSETPGRYRPYGGDEKSGGRHKSNSFSGYGDDDRRDMMSPPPAYRE